MPVTILENIQEGSGGSPAPGQTVTIEYTGWLFDASKGDKKGAQFDSSVGRGDFVVPIGVGKLIAGWDECVCKMQVGQKSTFHITSDMGYGSRGFPGAIPPNSDLVFTIQLKGYK